jgi:hypothetical protein
MIESSTCAYERTRTYGERMERTTCPPERMHPPEMSESCASPTRFFASSLNTNFAGGAV